MSSYQTNAVELLVVQFFLGKFFTLWQMFDDRVLPVNHLSITSELEVHVSTLWRQATSTRHSWPETLILSSCSRSSIDELVGEACDVKSVVSLDRSVGLFAVLTSCAFRACCWSGAKIPILRCAFCFQSKRVGVYGGQLSRTARRNGRAAWSFKTNKLQFRSCDSKSSQPLDR